MDIKKFQKIKLLVLDFDGVMTDNKVIVDENGKESVICNRSDGFGIELLKKAGIDVIVISKEKNKVVSARCKKLNIDCIQSIDKKIVVLQKEIEKKNLLVENVCFIGNDINDIECIKFVGIGIAVNDAYEDVKSISDYITRKKGGEGAIREICDLILKK
ncbi:HAD hydrolase family protein [archaeon]|jgi:YrbI family 3-deoxy-D-manno-octulosonate 8-phosphate phosphatase|nr:HAD hydrolase family protein [archaeon]MBT4352348.1 HAD hydrolase family protein [archaeon]MBT4647057.1 HAD hydrolase family protein [archaeon]MBT6820966.1 HAD hydrolase family protein [archaeon]MBT7392158.1 HAD hydrolase family protein [archaeon]